MTDDKATQAAETQADPFRRMSDGWAGAAGQWELLGNLAKQHAENVGGAHVEALQKTALSLQSILPGLAAPHTADALQAYLKDFHQRSVLFLDTLRQRGDSYIAREQEGFRPVLAFDYEVILDGRTLERPVNYALVRIQPPADFPPQREDGRPWVIIDPRAGHGSGIGGFKSESEVGVALRDGHPVYFVIFFPEPEPDQTLADVTAAEAEFLREVHRRHPTSPRPLVTGNCQGGWATMILAATHPDLTGPLVIAGAPMSYWAGEKGKNPFRYLGGVLGGSVPALLTSDLGGGRFDGANLVMNFEFLNPSNTLWRKSYDVFADVDRQADRFLEFENWWSGFYFMNESEIRWIVENLFVGNRLTRGQAVLDDGTPIDLTRIQVPVVVFASHGDNITPPQQALNWIPDLYESVADLKARGHVIIYTLHDSIGHLGIFVSAKVAVKQHKQITSVVKTIEALAPGLYEMLIEQDDDAFEVSFEARTIDDILALDDGREEEPSFGAVAQLSEWATKTYEITTRPLLQAMVTPDLADANRMLHPMRTQRYGFSSNNPLLAGLDAEAQRAREERAPVARDNPFVQLEQAVSDATVRNLDLFRDMRDAMIELSFHSLYGTPWMKQIGARAAIRREVRDVQQLPQVKDAISRAPIGGYSEAIVRMLLLLAQARGSVRRERLERSNELLHSQPPFDSMSPDHRNALIHEQSMIVEFARQEAVTTLPALLQDDVDRFRAINFVLKVAGPVEEMDARTIAMFKHLQQTLRVMARDWREPAQDDTQAAAEPSAPQTSDAATETPRQQATG